jgi:hypothetical protein
MTEERRKLARRLVGHADHRTEPDLEELFDPWPVMLAEALDEIDRLAATMKAIQAAGPSFPAYDLAGTALKRLGLVDEYQPRSTDELRKSR